MEELESDQPKSQRARDFEARVADVETEISRRQSERAAAEEQGGGANQSAADRLRAKLGKPPLGGVVGTAPARDPSPAEGVSKGAGGNQSVAAMLRARLGGRPQGESPARLASKRASDRGESSFVMCGFCGHLLCAFRENRYGL